MLRRVLSFALGALLVLARALLLVMMLIVPIPLVQFPGVRDRQRRNLPALVVKVRAERR
ncbi:MAG: hypothetical protein K1X89_02825 [Myxococcaceae bacterium]|nr:hypothetical protein [Myxococcaceae bacterium]